MDSRQSRMNSRKKSHRCNYLIFRRDGKVGKETLTRLVVQFTKPCLLLLSTERNDLTRTVFLEHSQWHRMGPVCEEDSSYADFYHHCMGSLLASSWIIERHNKIGNTTSKSHGVLYVVQKWLDMHPLKIKATDSTIWSAFWQGKQKSLHNRCFNCWIPECALRTFPKPEATSLSSTV